MAQNLTVCRIGQEWGFRDVTGEAYGLSPDIREVVQAAERMAGRLDAHVVFSADAEEHFRSVTINSSLDSQRQRRRNLGNRFRSFLTLMARWRGKR